MATAKPKTKRTHSQLSPDLEIIKNLKDLRNENENNKKIASLEKINNINKKDLENLRKELNKPNIEKKSTSLKIIVKNSGIKDPTQENLKKYIDLNIISIKKAKLDVGTLILEIDIKNIHKCKAENWKNVNKEISINIDRYNKEISTLCINKIYLDETSTLTLDDTYNNLHKINKNIFNIRYNRQDNPNLILFETLTSCYHLFNNQQLNIPDLNSKFTMRVQARFSSLW